MTIRSILKMGDQRLLTPCAPVEDVRQADIQQLIADMWETMAEAGGVGLAAPQIGVNLQVMVFGTGQASARSPERPVVPRTVLINPTITPVGQRVEHDWEGCLSIPGLRGWVPRWHCIQMSGLNAEGAAISQTLEGFHARVVQHEFDHLQGVLYPMQMKDMTRFGFTDVLFPELNAPIQTA